MCAGKSGGATLANVKGSKSYPGSHFANIRLWGLTNLTDFGGFRVGEEAFSQTLFLLLRPIQQLHLLDWTGGFPNCFDLKWTCKRAASISRDTWTFKGGLWLMKMSIHPHYTLIAFLCPVSLPTSHTSSNPALFTVSCLASVALQSVVLEYDAWNPDLCGEVATYLFPLSLEALGTASWLPAHWKHYTLFTMALHYLQRVWRTVFHSVYSSSVTTLWECPGVNILMLLLL